MTHRNVLIYSVISFQAFVVKVIDLHSSFVAGWWFLIFAVSVTRDEVRSAVAGRD